jgi:hypothetical protein
MKSTKKAQPKQSTPSTETAATTVSSVSESTKHYPTGAELIEKAEKALQEEAKLDVTALENMTKGLSDLAEKAVKGNKFTEEQAKQELTLRAQFLNVTKSFFASKLERGRALMEYQGFYSPLGMLSDFLKVVGVDRRTAYRWIDLAKAEREVKSGKSKQSPSLAYSKQSPLQQRYLDSSMVPRVKDIVSYAKKAVKGLSEDDQKAVLRAVLEMLTDYRKTIGIVGEPLKVHYVEKAA